MWTYQDDYFKLLVSFANCSGSGNEFMDRLLELRAFHILESDRLIDEFEINFEQAIMVPINFRAFGFNHLLKFENCDDFVSNELLETIDVDDSRSIDEIDENQLRARVEETISIILE